MALTLNGYPITDFSGRDPGLPSVIKNGNPERIALYPLAHDDGGAGTLRDQVTLTNATLSGGSTLLAQEKFRNDFQRLTSTFPSLGYRASGAVTNLEYALDPDNPSAEGGTTGTHTATNGGITVITTDFWHGSRCFKQTPTGAAPTFDTDLMAVTAASTEYTTAAMVKATATRTIRASLVGDTSGATPADFPATGDWQLVYVTKTFAAGDTTSRDRSISLTDGIAGDTFLVDSIILVAGATVPQFEEKECAATSCTFPTPFTAGEDVSFVIYFWAPRSGATAGNRVLMACMGTAPGKNRIIVYYNANLGIVQVMTYDNASLTKFRGVAVNAVNWPAGTFHGVALSLAADNTQRIAFDGTLGAVAAGVGVRESAVGATTYFGTDQASATHWNGLILPFIYRGVAWGDAECEYYSTLQAPPPRTRMVF